MAVKTSSCAEAATAILNLRGRLLAHGLRRKKRVMASTWGVVSKVPPVRIPDQGEPVTVRTVLPQASRVVMPASSQIRMTSSASRSFTK